MLNAAEGFRLVEVLSGLSRVQLNGLGGALKGGLS